MTAMRIVKNHFVSVWCMKIESGLPADQNSTENLEVVISKSQVDVNFRLASSGGQQEVTRNGEVGFLTNIQWW